MKALMHLLQKTKYLNTVLAALSFLLFIMILLMIFNASSAMVETETSDTLHGDNLHRIIDTLYEEEEREYLEEDSSYERMHYFNHLLRSSDEFPFYHVNPQPIGVNNFQGTEHFDAMYELGGEPEYWELDSGEYRVINAIQLNETAYELNQLNIIEGEGFQEDDFSLSDDSIPLLLGNSYEGIYDIGDTISFAHFFVPFEGQVVGFLDNSESVVGTNEPEHILDRAIVLPALFPTQDLAQQADMDGFESEEERIFVEASLLTGMNGWIVSNENEVEVTQYINTLQERSNFAHADLIDQNIIGVNVLAQMTDANSTFVYGTLIFIFMVSASLFYFLLFTKIKKSIDVVNILLIYGITKKGLQKLLHREAMVLVLFGFIISTGIAWLLFPNNPGILATYIGVSVLLVLVFIGVSYFFISSILERLQLVERLKRGSL